MRREPSPNSSLSPARLTPDSDSEDSDLDVGGLGELGESFQMQRRQRGLGKAGGVDLENNSEDDEDDDDNITYKSRARRGSMSTVQSFQLYTPDEEHAIVKKFDRKLVSFVAVLYLLSFLDRSSKSRLLSIRVWETNLTK
jgi:hypothetical protein